MEQDNGVLDRSERVSDQEEFLLDMSDSREFELRIGVKGASSDSILPSVNSYEMPLLPSEKFDRVRAKLYLAASQAAAVDASARYFWDNSESIDRKVSELMGSADVSPTEDPQGHLVYLLGVLADIKSGEVPL